MINGQLNVVSMPTVTPSVTQEASVSNAVTTSETQQGREGFAGMLKGIQSHAKTKESPDSEQVEQATLDVGADPLAIGLLAGLTVLPAITSASEVTGTKEEYLENTVVVDDESQQSAVTDLASQMVLAAYAQPVRMPDTNTTVSLSADALQNVASVSEQPVAVSATSVEKQPKQASAEQQSATTLPLLKSDRMSEVNNLIGLPAEILQKVAVAPEKPGLIFVSTEKTNGERVVVEAVKTPLVLSPATAVQASVEPVVPQGTKIVEQGATILEKVIAATVGMPATQTEQSKSLSAGLVEAVVPLQSAESELDIQLSQPQPITARPTVAAVLTGSRLAASVQGNGAGQRPGSEQPIENVRTGNELADVKEMVSSLQSSESASGSTLGSGSSQGGEESNQEQSDSATDNQMLAQNMRVQLGSEHQKVSALSAKTVSGEPVTQAVPEQIVQQVKEHLQLHDVKPGSQQITLTLSPDSLGELKMNLNLQGQKLSVEIVTENRSVRDVIIQHTDALKESLARQNITMESFDVTTGGKGSGNQGQNQNAWRELAQQQQQQSWVSPRGYQVAQADLPTGQATYQRAQGQSMLDIHY